MIKATNGFLVGSIMLILLMTSAMFGTWLVRPKTPTVIKYESYQFNPPPAYYQPAVQEIDQSYDI